MNVILGVTGGIAAYKSCDLINMLRKDGHDVRVIMTENAKQFITPMTLATLSKHPVMDNMWEERKGTVDHIDVATWAELFVVYPATANIIGKFANGIADDLLSTVFLALPHTTQKVIFPAMNTNMYKNPAVQRNCKTVGAYVTETRTGMLACNVEGEGCLLQPKRAMEILAAWLNNVSVDDKASDPPSNSPLFSQDKIMVISAERIKEDLDAYKKYIDEYQNEPTRVFYNKPLSFFEKFGYSVHCSSDGVVTVSEEIK